jgi:hypothetical protein
VGGGEQLAAADRRLHGRSLHGRRGDAGHEAAGIPVVERIDEIPDAVKDKLGAKV